MLAQPLVVFVQQPFRFSRSEILTKKKKSASQNVLVFYRVAISGVLDLRRGGRGWYTGRLRSSV